MSTYVIGDVQGCLVPLQRLLEKINFDASKDVLWFTGDLVNRGPSSLSVLRFLKKLDNVVIVLGNHDLHLLGVFYGIRALHHKDTLHDILSASDAHEIINWLRTKPLLYHDKIFDCVLVHAGLAPEWDLQTAQDLAHEVEHALQGENVNQLIAAMYGDEPAKWNDELVGYERLRCIINYLTRMRFCYSDGRLDFSYKGTLQAKPKELTAWFHMPGRRNTGVKIIFGHWAALGGVSNDPNIIPLDTGCVWGNCLTALRLEDSARFTIQC